MKTPRKNNNLDIIEKEVEKKYAKRDKKGSRGMKISGGSVKKLVKIIKSK